MGKKDKDTQSATSSSASKMSLERGRNPKPPRFSLRRFFCRRPSARSMRSLKSNQEVETRSVGGLHVPSDRGETSRAESRVTDRESPQNLSRISMDEMSHHSSHSVHSSQGKKSKDQIECPLCLNQQPKENFPQIMTCHHRSCRDCLKQYLKIEITESRINIACPECAERFHPNDIKAILDNESLMNKYEEFMLRRVLVLDPDTRWCPAPDCGYAVIAAGCASCPRLRCERDGCRTSFCYHCKQYWHPNQTCDAARAERTSNVRSSSVSYSHESANSDIKPCPRCGAFIVKMDDGSCNHMTCAVCGAEFCWLCMKEISDLHYLSPSGCTFWGKKPWSRKKKILWQLGTLVGAPVGIALVAGIAVPAMIIGIPVWVGRKLYAKYQSAPKHKRNLIIVGGVLASVVISPVLAGLAVGIGVPILLAYVYGVVPISLCRSGGCGVTTNSSGVRFEFDDDNDVTVGVSGPYSGGEVQSIEQMPQINNPSIGPSIGELSLGMTNSLSASGSHMERIGIIHESDRESASHRAIAGNSLTGSLSGSTLGGTSGYQRVEIQADVAPSTSSNKEKRASLSSESANLSLDAKSATISFGDNASTKALAGSICTKDKDNNSAIIPPIETVAVDMVSTTQPTTSVATTTTCLATDSGVTKATSSRHGSPTSSRSVSFMCDEVQDHQGSVKKKKFKLQSVGDSIQEHSSSTSTELTSSSTLTDSASVTAHGDYVKYSRKAPQYSKVGGQGSRSRSTSSDSMTSRHSSFNGSNSMPEVENDHPGNPTETKLVKLVSSTDMGSSSIGFGGAKPKNGVYFSKSGNGSGNKHRPVNQMESCPSLLYESTKETALSHSSSATIHNKSPSLGTIPDQPTLTRSKVTVDGQKRVTYESSPGSSSSMLHSPSFSGCHSNSGSSSDNSTCELLRKSAMVAKMQISDL